MKALCLILLLFICTVAHGQNLVWQKLFYYTNTASELFGEITKTADGGFIAAGIHSPGYQTLFVKYTANGDTVWSRAGTIDMWTGEQEIVQTSDGGYGFVGAHMNVGDFINRSDLLLVKLSTTGDTLWTRRYDPFQLTDRATGLLELPDKGFLITGTVQNPTPPVMNEDYYLIRTDSLGNVIWEQEYGGPLSDYTCQSTLSGRGTIILSGSTNSYSGAPAIAQPYLIEISAGGAILQQKQVVVKDANEFAEIYRMFNNLIVSSDGGYVFIGRADTASGNTSLGFVAKVDTAFNLLWTYVERPQSGQDFNFTKVKELTDSTFIAIGNDETWASNKFVLVKLSKSGQLISRHIFTTLQPFVRMYDFELMGDSSLIAVGRYWGNSLSIPGAYVVKIGNVGMPSPPPFLLSAAGPALPTQVAYLSQNYPNPFSGETTITYRLPAGVQQAELLVRDIMTGRVVKRQGISANEGSIIFNCGQLANGLYTYSISIQEQQLAVQKLIIIR